MEINGLIGVLADIKEEDLIENFNSFSIVHSSRVGLQLLMLGPNSFVIETCVSNVAYLRLGKVTACAPMKNIKSHTARSSQIAEKAFNLFVYLK